VQRSVVDGTPAVPAHHPAGPAAMVQRMPKKAAKKTAKSSTKDEPAPEASSSGKSEYEKIFEFFEGLSEEFKAKRPNEKEDILEALGFTPDNVIYSLSEAQSDESLLKDFLEAVETTKFTSGYAGGGGGSSDWATSAITAKHRQMREDHPHWGEQTTLHHKISRSELDAILTAAQRDGARARPLFDFLDEIRTVLASTAGDKKALHNMPANLEMGPASDTRIGDPGSGTDFNFTPEGAMTPRSSELKGALAFANQSTVDWSAVAEKLREAQRLQVSNHQGALLSDPALERWQKIGAKWKKASD
jgi:hypothetical protein